MNELEERVDLLERQMRALNTMCLKIRDAMLKWHLAPGLEIQYEFRDAVLEAFPRSAPV